MVFFVTSCFYIQSKPYVMKKVEVWKSTEPEVLEKMPFAQKYEGYVVDLIRALSKQVKFKYNMYIVEDGAYGAQLPNGEWNGMIRDLIDHVRNVLITI